MNRTCFLILLTFLFACKSDVNKNETPAQVVTKLFEAIEKKDYTAMENKCTKNSKLSITAFKFYNLLNTDTNKINLNELKPLSTAIQGDSAIVELGIEDKKERKIDTLGRIYIRKEDGSWKIDMGMQAIMAMASTVMIQTEKQALKEISTIDTSGINIQVNNKKASLKQAVHVLDSLLKDEKNEW